MLKNKNENKVIKDIMKIYNQKKKMLELLNRASIDNLEKENLEKYVRQIDSVIEVLQEPHKTIVNLRFVDEKWRNKKDDEIYKKLQMGSSKYYEIKKDLLKQMYQMFCLLGVISNEG